MATASSGLSCLLQGLPKNSESMVSILVIRVEPPTRITSSISSLVRLAYLSASLTGTIDLSKYGYIRCSKSALLRSSSISNSLWKLSMEISPCVELPVNASLTYLHSFLRRAFCLLLSTFGSFSCALLRHRLVPFSSLNFSRHIFINSISISCPPS